MSIFFDKRPSIQTTWKTEKTLSDTAALNRFLWDSLSKNIDPSPLHLSISITPVHSFANPFVCWALLNEEVN